MKIFGEKIKSENGSRIRLIFLLGIIWRISIGEYGIPSTRFDPYVFPVVSFFLLSVVAGEFTRRIIHLFTKKPVNQNPYYTEEILSKESKSADVMALNFGIAWGIVYLIFIVINKYSV